MIQKNLALLVAFSGAAVFAQTTLPSVNPQDIQQTRGIVPASSYSVSDIETINTSNGNILLHIPIVSLPAGRAGFTSGVSLIYNSNIYDVSVSDEISPGSSNCLATYDLFPSETGGWQLGVGYQVQWLQRPGTPCVSQIQYCDANNPSDCVPANLYALGIRNAMGLYVNPETGELWKTENGPQGGDQINIIKAGKNYGWPVISYGRAYTGELTGGTGPVLDRPFAPDMEQPFVYWSPSIAAAAITFYTANRFPAWKGNIFVGGLVGTQLHRIVLSKDGLPLRRQALLTELNQRIREVQQGPDGLLYLLTDEEAGSLLRLEPVDAQ
jgi:hypothetical protein